MKLIRTLIRSWPMLLLGVAGVVTTLLFHSWIDEGGLATVWYFARAAAGVLAIAALYASVFDTRRDRLVVAVLGVALAALLLAGSSPIWLAQLTSDPALESRIEAHFGLGGELAPDVVLTSPDEEPVRLARLRPSYVLLDFWVRGMRDLEDHLLLRRLALAELDDARLVLIGVMPENAEELEEEIRSGKAPHRVVKDDGRIADAFHVPEWGGSILVGPDGTILEVALDGLDGLHRMARAIRGPDWDPKAQPVPRVR